MAWYKEIENIVFVYHYGIAICQQIESPLWVKFVLLNKFLALSNWEGQWKGILSLVLFPALSILLIPALSLDSVPVPAVCCRSGNWSLKTKKWTTRTPQAAETNKAKKTPLLLLFGKSTWMVHAPRRGACACRSTTKKKVVQTSTGISIKKISIMKSMD